MPYATPLIVLLITTIPFSTPTSTSNFPSPFLYTNQVDYIQIHQTLNTYPLSIDTKNFALLASVFTSDAVANYNTGVGILIGLAQIQNSLAVREPEYDRKLIDDGSLYNSLAPVKTQHALTTQLISFENDTMANTITYYTASHFGQGEAEGQVLYAYGKYLDTLIKISNDSSSDEDAIWRISTRELVYMGPFTGNMSVFES